MRIGPNDILQNGAKVQIGGKIGTVVSHEVVPAHNGGMITVHTFKLTHKVDTTSFHKRIIPLKKEITQAASYASVWTL